MDNLTHSFAGALLAQMGLKKLSGRATSTLVIAANIPDIDAVTTLLGRQSLILRRGLTHGPIALALLPLILTGLVLLWNRWRPVDQPIRLWPLLLCAYIGTMSHPALDWLNSYGVRLLEPFSSTWYAGDTLFIIDIWVWAALIGCWLWSRHREKRGGDWQRPAWIGFTAIGAYILGNGLITAKAEALGRDAVRTMVYVRPIEGLKRASYRPFVQKSRPDPTVTPDLVLANPQPLAFWRRTVLWRGEGQFGTLDYSAGREWNGIIFEDSGVPTHLDHPALAAARGRKDVEAYLFWSRMPIVIERDGVTYLADQRFNSELTRNQFLVPLTSPPLTSRP
jgi:inner membrane protein